MTGGAGACWSPEVFAHMPLNSPDEHIFALPRCYSYRKNKNKSRKCVGSCSVKAVTERQIWTVSLPPCTPSQPCFVSKLSKTQAIFGHRTVLVHKIPTYYCFLFVIATKKHA